MSETDLIFHNDCIKEFNNRLYSDILTDENIVSSKKAIKIANEKFYGFFLEKHRERYFMMDNHLEDLPFRIAKFQETDYKNDVFKFILKPEPITIPSVKRMDFRTLVDTVGNFKHSSPLDWTLYKIVCITSWVDRINARISTEPGFGKDSIANILSNLVNSTANIYGATFAKLEFLLINKLIVLNELGNLKKEEAVDMQEFLLATGAYYNNYTKRTRKTSTTQEQYDISDLSLMIFYNLPKHYTNKAQEYFDQIFTKAVKNRFMPFTFDGFLTTRFDKLIDVKAIVDENKEIYTNVIATLNYYKENRIQNILYEVDKDVVKFDKELMRYSRTFNVIMKYISEYSNSREEFNHLTSELYKRYLKYLDLVNTEHRDEKTEEAPKQRTLK